MIKNRDGTRSHYLFDAVRGATKELNTNNTNDENTNANGLQSFNSDGFTLGSEGEMNANSSTFASWNWKAGAGAGSSNTDGSTNTTSTSVNTTAGFSISKYSGTGSNATIGHGLGVAPSLIIVKNLSIDGRNWQIFHHKNTASPATQQLEFGTDATATVTTQWNSAMPTSSVFSIGTNDSINKSGNDFIAYAFTEKTGYSKFGSYTGNGNADGTYVYTGFKPAFVLIKNTASGSTNWQMYDNKREGYNPQNDLFRANLNSAEGNGTDPIDIYSNGFKNMHTASSQNTNGDTYVYMAFGQSIVGSNDIAATAR